MSNDGNRTVFRPSPLQGRGASSAPPKIDSPPFDVERGGGPTAPPRSTSPAPSSVAGYGRSPSRRDDDVPPPPVAQRHRNPMVAHAAPILALAAALRSGRVREPLAHFHAQASAAVAAFDRAIADVYPADVRQRATYALCSTIDDIAQNLPGIGAERSEWARRSLVVQMFREAIGGDRFWTNVEDLLARPAGQDALIELVHACLAAGFEGRFRVTPDGPQRLTEIMARLYGALDIARTVSDRELVTQWRGADVPAARVGGWSRVMLAGAVATGLLLLLFIGLRLLLIQSGQPAWAALAAIEPAEPLRLSRGGATLPTPPSRQAVRLETFLAPEIAAHLVAVDRDTATVRVRTTVGELFRSGSDSLEPGRDALFRRIGAAIDTEPGPVRVEGHADSDQPRGLTFPDNNALSAARAKMVTGVIAATLTDPSRLTAEGFGDSQPIASNDTAEGKALNRRVEIVLERHD